MLSKVRTRSALAVALLGVFGCRDDQRAWAARLEAARPLAGAWHVQMSAEPVDGMATRRAFGELALTLNEEHLGTPDLFGAYDLSFAPLGFTLSPSTGVPSIEVVAAGDSITLVLAPGSQFPITMRGVRQGDSILGRWSAHQRAGSDALGTFALTRVVVTP